jgi:hypothetical protein
LNKPLTSHEVEANPEIICDPDARQKRRNRSGQGRGKERIPGPFAWKLIKMLESPAYRVLSPSAKCILERLEIEFYKHGGKAEENGNLACTYKDFVKHGISNGQIASAIRELVALGFLIIAQEGKAGNAEFREDARYLLTYRHFGSHKYVGNGWRKVETMEQAEAIAKEARNRKPDNQASKAGLKYGFRSESIPKTYSKRPF